ncbi:MAG: hypothetical protein P0Y64_16860 [Candidatus Sphingomonas colombiensis]|nr:hypothetical protein [Sphingomonas sp.]WEK42991.1 MAG: hypothetical protein P0Y64_16860 [Sphingomonas sp.]
MEADWAILRGHPDFATKWRGTIDPEECEAAQDVPGGLVALWDKGIGKALAVVEQPESGDIAVVAAGGIEVGAIFTGERWAIRGQRTVHFLAPDMVTARKVWRL